MVIKIEIQGLYQKLCMVNFTTPSNGCLSVLESRLKYFIESVKAFTFIIQKKALVKKSQ